ncbi:ABC transporter ATP-binding protein [Phyllobacterium sp. TAF24]|uniref:ABC transporter ATP-binding protein n=1 Tax=unclassified Phyllobacterium TaxID=2638441 RepID=UPI00088E6C2A|nr:ATP-binding cassette domain-containing protein [Phyllobacterium sp. OV277]SDP50317.1 capsular polysaccharide transport system ATP-binding protein [Phyllobacterium sp. OV277]
MTNPGTIVFKDSDGVPQQFTTNVPAQEGLSKNGVVGAYNLVKEYPIHGGTRRVLDNINFEVRAGEKIAILGHNGAGKSTLVRLIAGIEMPTSGHVARSMSLSWPIALSGGFGGSMTGFDCMRFLSRIYNRPFDEIRDCVETFSDLGKYLQMPIKTYSSGMRARLSFGLSLAIDFDCYLIDEVIAVGDQRFQRRSFDELFVKRKNRAMIIVGHTLDIIADQCKSALVLKNGRGRVFDDVKFAFDIYASL